jgi:predicted membrane chloride channel (bestrophin family)
MKSFFQRVIEIPAQLQTALLAALIGLAVQLEVWLGPLVGVDLTEKFQVIAAAAAVLIGFLAKAALEKYVPEKLHPIVNSVLVWLASFFGALALLKAL